MERACWLVSPDHRAYVVRSQTELESLIETLGIGWRLAANLRQLCEFNAVAHDRAERKRAEGGWTLLEHVRWLRRDGCSHYIVAIGTAASIRANVLGLKEVTASDDVVKNLLNGKKKQWPKGWACLPKGEMPAAAASLSSGASIDRLSVAPTEGASGEAAPAVWQVCGAMRPKAVSSWRTPRALFCRPRRVAIRRFPAADRHRRGLGAA